MLHTESKLSIYRERDSESLSQLATASTDEDMQLRLVALAKDCNVYEQWLRTERELEGKWEALEEQTFVEIIGFGKRQSQWMKYDPPEGPKTVPCRPGLSAIQPWACNRVLLSAEGAPALASDGETVDPDPTYVNASLMGHSFIAAGVPQNPDAREAFWRLVVEQRVAQVVMLNQPLEQDNMPYWPHTMTPSGKDYRDLLDQPVRFGRVEVTLRGSRRANAATWHRRLEVRLDGGEARAVDQHHFTQWPDMAVPSDPQLFLEGLLLPVLHLRATHDDRVLVHCHGGLGRTGTFICAAILLIEREAAKRGLMSKIATVSEKVLDLRKQRPDQVQAAEQYKFIHRILYGIEMPHRSVDDQWSTLRDALRRSGINKSAGGSAGSGLVAQRPLAQSPLNPSKSSSSSSAPMILPSSTATPTPTTNSSTSSTSSSSTDSSVLKLIEDKGSLATKDLSHLSQDELIQLVRLLAR